MQHLRRDDGHFVAKELRTALETSRKEACTKKIYAKRDNLILKQYHGNICLLLILNLMVT